MAQTDHHREGASPRRMLDTLEAATYAGLGKSTLEKLRLYGGGPTYIKVGKRVVYDISDLDAWLASRRRQSTSQVAAQCARRKWRRPPLVAQRTAFRTLIILQS